MSIKLNCSQYNTMPEQVNENQKNIKTLADAYDIIANDYSKSFKVLDLSEYENRAVLPQEIINELSQDNIAIIYKCQVNYDTYKAIYNIASRGGYSIEFIATSSQPDQDGDYANLEISINRVIIDVNTRVLTYSYDTRQVVDNEKLDDELEEKMTIVDLSDYNNGDTISQDEYNLLLNDSTYGVYRQLDDIGSAKVLLTRREITTNNITLYGNVTMGGVNKDITVIYIILYINRTTRELTIYRRKDISGLNLIDFGIITQGDTIPQSMITKLLENKCIVSLRTSSTDDEIYSTYRVEDDMIYGNCSEVSNTFVVNIGWALDTTTGIIDYEEYECELINGQTRSYTPYYDSVNNQYVVNLEYDRNFCGVIHGGWNSRGIKTKINIGSKFCIFNTTGGVDGVQNYYNVSDNFITLMSNYGGRQEDGVMFAVIGDIVIVTLVLDI